MTIVWLSIEFTEICPLVSKKALHGTEQAVIWNKEGLVIRRVYAGVGLIELI